MRLKIHFFFLLFSIFVASIGITNTTEKFVFNQSTINSYEIPASSISETHSENSYADRQSNRLQQNSQTNPVIGSKIGIKSIFQGVACVQKEFLHQSLSYFLSLKIIITGLSVRDIIFPFHYFW